MLEAIPQCQLVHHDRAQGKPTGVDQPFGWHLAMHVEDTFELLVEILVRDRAQLVEDRFSSCAI
jgi:hypothetical protein